MARIKKFSPKENLTSFNTFVIDNGNNSDYFKITEFKDTFTGGKNGFLIEGSPYLKESTEIKMEILDVNGDPIYYEPGNGIPEYYEGISKLIAVYVYNDTPIGTAKITILGELKEYIDESGIVRQIPEEWRGVYNVKWEREFKVNKLLSNEDKVRFYRRPKVQIDEIVKPIFSGTPPTTVQTGSVNGLALSPTENSDLSNFTLPTSYRLKVVSGSGWTGSMERQTITFDNLNYSPRVDEVVNDTEIIVSPPYTENNIVKSFTDEDYSISFTHLEGFSDLATALTGSFARINISDMKTFVGDAARVKVYRRSQSNLTDYEFVQEIQLESNELLTDTDTFDKKEERYGIFTQDVVNNYWVTSSSEIVPTINQDFLYNSVKLDSTSINTFFTSRSFDVREGVEYTLTFNVRRSGSVDSDDYVKAFLGSTPGPVVEEAGPSIPCSQESSYSGGESYPTTQSINLGQNTGNTNLQYNSQTVPDRFIVEWSGSVVIDTGYVGSNEYDFGGVSRSTFTSALNGRVDPITSNTYPDLSTYSDDGYPRVTTQANPSLIAGSGSANFNKTDSSPILADVKVYAPLSGTAWSFVLNCPENPPVSIIERISNPTTIQDITTVNSSNTTLQKTPIEVNFLADDIDDVRLYFEVSGSDWYLSDVSLKASQETSFSPDVITFIQQVPKTLVTETFDYRFEFYDINNNFIPVRVEQTKTFTGGNNNLFNKSIEVTPDNLYFTFDSASNPANALPPTIINFDVETNLITGSITYLSSAYDPDGIIIPSESYSSGYPGFLSNLSSNNGRQPFLRVEDFTGSRDDITVQFIQYTAEVEGVSDTFVITRVEDGKGGVNHEILPYRGTIIKNKESKTLEIQAIRIDGTSRIELKDGLKRGFSDAKLHLLSSSLDGVDTYVSLSQAITNPDFIRGVSAGKTGSGEIDYNAEFNRDAIDNELTVYLMDGPTTESILTSLILTDLKDGLGNGTITTTAEQFGINVKPTETTGFRPLQSKVTASFYRRGTTTSPLSASLEVFPSMSREPKTTLPRFYMFYETGAFDDTITVAVTDFQGNSINSGIPGVTSGVPFYSADETKQLNFEFTYTEPITSASVTANKSLFIVPDGLPGRDSITIEIDSNPVALGSNPKGDVYNYSLADTTIQINQGDFYLVNTASGDPGTFTTRSVTSQNISFTALDGNSTTTMSLAGFTDMTALSASVVYNFDIYPYFTSSLITASRTQKFTKVVEGAGAIEVLLEPSVVNFNADEVGYIQDYAAANTEIRVKQDEEYLLYDSSNSGTPGTFVTTSISASNITVGQLSSSNQDASSGGDEVLHFNGFSNMTYTTASVDYHLRIYPYSLKNGVAGVPTNVTKRQIISKTGDGASARKVTLLSTSDTIVYDGDGTQVSPEGAVQLSATATNTTASNVYYTFVDVSDDTILAGPSLSNVYTVQAGDLPQTGSTKIFKVELRDGSTTRDADDIDSVTISGLGEGTNAYSAMLTNPASSVTVERDGTIYFDNAGTLIRAYKGGSELQYVEQYDESALDPITFLPIGTFGQFSASIYDISSFLTLGTNRDGKSIVSKSISPTEDELYASSSVITNWNLPADNTQGFIVYKVDFENGRSTQFLTQTFSTVFEGATGPGIVVRGEWTGSIDYLFSLEQQRRDAVVYKYDPGNGGDIETHYFATTQTLDDNKRLPYVPADGITDEPEYDGTQEQGDVDTFGWEYLGEQDLFVAAKIAIFEESFVENTINVGQPPADDPNANITIAGSGSQPFIAIGQSGIQGFQQTGIFMGIDNNGGEDGQTKQPVFSLKSEESGVPATYKSLEWNGEALTIRGAIRQTEAGAVEPGLRGDWQSGVDYNVNDSVIYAGQSWSCNTIHTSTASGTTGPPGVGSYWDSSSGTGKTVTLSADTFVIEYNQDGTSPSPSTINLFASSSNFIDPYFKFTGGGSNFTDETTFTNGVDGDNDIVASISVPTNISGMPLQFRVGVADGGLSGQDQTEVVSDVINIFGIKPGADADPQYFITPLNGTQIKNSSGALQLKVQSSDPINGLQDVTTGDIKIYSGSTLITNISGVTGTDYNPTISDTAIFGTMNLRLYDGSETYDGITLLDVTDGLGGGTFKTPNLKTTRDQNNNFTPTFLSATASFFSTNGTEYSASVAITPSLVGITDYMEVSTAVGDTSEITITAGNGDGGTITLGGSAVATKDTVLTAVFTDPVSGKSTTITETFYIVSDGLDGIDAITIINTNQAHTLPATNTGFVTDYTDSGTDIQIFEGVNELSYDGVGTSDGTWKVDRYQNPSSTITLGSITDNGDSISVGDFSSMANGTDSVSIKYSITGSRLDGTEFKVQTTQTITKAKAGSDGAVGNTVQVTADNLVINYDSDGTNPSPSSIKLMATSSNFSDGYFKFTGAGLYFSDETSFTDGDGQNTDSATFSAPLTYTASPFTFRVGVAEGNQVEVASDTVTITPLKSGTDANPSYFITPLNGTQLKNGTGTLELQAQSSDPTNGLQNLTNPNAIKIYSGSTEITNISGVTGTDWNPTIPASAIFGTMTLTLKNLSTTFDTITLVDVTDGLGGGTFLSPNIKTTRNQTTNTFTPSALSATASFFTPTGTEYTASVRIYPTVTGSTDYMGVSLASGDTSEITITAGDGDGGTITLGGLPAATKDAVLTAVFTDPVTNQTSTITETFYIISDGLDGIDAIAITNTNPAHTLPSDSSGDVSDYSNSGTIIEVFEGTASLAYDGVGTSDGTWKVDRYQIPGGTITLGGITDNGNTITIGNFSSMDTGTDAVSIKYAITGSRKDGTQFFGQTTQNITKAKAGATAKNLTISADSQVYVFDDASDTTAADDTIRVYINQQNLSGTIATGDITITDALSGTITTPSLTGTVTNGTGEQYFDIVFNTSTGDITSKTQLPVSILVQKDSITDSTSLNKLEGGASNEPMYFIAPQNGTQIKNGSGTLEFKILESAPGALNTITTGNIKLYSGSNLITTYAGVTGTDYNPTIAASAIQGTMLLTLKDGSNTYDSVQILDVTDGLGGGSFISPNLKMTRQANNTYLPSNTSLTASFYDVTGSEHTKAVAIYPNLDNGTDYMFYTNNAGSHTDSEITLTIDDGDGTVFGGTGIGNKLPTKDVVVTATFTDSNTGQSNTMTETVYIVSDGVDGLDALTIILSNETHTIPADSAGTVLAGGYVGSGTKISVYEGKNQLDYDGVGTSNSTFKVVAVGTDITPGSISDDVLNASVADHSNMTADSASIQYQITGSRVSGSSFTISKFQSFAKVKAGADGQDGADGADGVDGVDGQAAGIVYAGAWDITDATAQVPTVYLAEPDLKYVVGYTSGVSNYWVAAQTHRYKGEWSIAKVNSFDTAVDDVMDLSGTYYISTQATTGEGVWGSGTFYQQWSVVRYSGQPYVNKSGTVSPGGSPPPGNASWTSYTITDTDLWTSIGSSIAPGTWNGGWDSFGAEFTSVATDILFAQDVYANKTVNIGTGDNNNPVIALNADSASGYANPYISIGQDPPGFEEDGIFLGFSGGEAAFSLLTTGSKANIGGLRVDKSGMFFEENVVVGTQNVAGTTVTSSNYLFEPATVGGTLTIDGSTRTISSRIDNNHVTINSSIFTNATTNWSIEYSSGSYQIPLTGPSNVTSYAYEKASWRNDYPSKNDAAVDEDWHVRWKTVNTTTPSGLSTVNNNTFQEYSIIEFTNLQDLALSDNNINDLRSAGLLPANPAGTGGSDPIDVRGRGQDNAPILYIQSQNTIGGDLFFDTGSVLTRVGFYVLDFFNINSVSSTTGYNAMILGQSTHDNTLVFEDCTVYSEDVQGVNQLENGKPWDSNDPLLPSVWLNAQLFIGETVTEDNPAGVIYAGLVADVTSSIEVVRINSSGSNNNPKPYISMGQITQEYKQSGIFLGFDNNDPKFSLSGSNGYIEFDGTSFDYSGGVTNGNIVGGTLTIGSGSDIFKADDNGIYLGSATFLDAPFRVTSAGNLFTSNATVSGSIDVQEGRVGDWIVEPQTDGGQLRDAAELIRLDSDAKEISLYSGSVAGGFTKRVSIKAQDDFSIGGDVSVSNIPNGNGTTYSLFTKPTGPISNTSNNTTVYGSYTLQTLSAASYAVPNVGTYQINGLYTPLELKVTTPTGTISSTAQYPDYNPNTLGIYPSHYSVSNPKEHYLEIYLEAVHQTSGNIVRKRIDVVNAKSATSSQGYQWNFSTETWSADNDSAVATNNSYGSGDVDSFQTVSNFTMTFPEAGNYKFRYSHRLGSKSGKSQNVDDLGNLSAAFYTVTSAAVDSGGSYNNIGYASSGLTILIPTNIIELTGKGLQILQDTDAFIKLDRIDGGVVGLSNPPIMQTIKGGKLQFYQGSTFNGTHEFLEVQGKAQFYRLQVSSGTSLPYGVTNAFVPTTDGNITLGTSSQRWGQIYSDVGSISTSDRRRKTDISGSLLGLDFINSLNPVSYKLKNNTSGRTHYGLIAQEVSESLASLPAPVNSDEFAAFIQSDIYVTGSYTGSFTGSNFELGVGVDARDISEIKSNPEEYGSIDEWKYSHTTYGLRYSEFISPMIKAIQELSNKVDELQAQISGSNT